MSRPGWLPQLVRDLWRFSREGRKVGFLVLALLLLALGALIVLTEQTAVMPFIYTIF